MLNKYSLLHNSEAFKFEAITNRANKLRFNNLNRFEIFLWDLEIFSQLQKFLKDNIVLKGGAATVMYIPINYQRTSVDIDMVTIISKEEIESILEKIKISLFDSSFNFKLHKPKNLKTLLPLYTYFFEFPSITSENNFSQNEIKLEFIIKNKMPAIYKMNKPELFAIEKSLEYNILPIHVLIADKLTTLGPNTVGVPNMRNDEQPKHIYDIYHLIKFNIGTIKMDEIWQYYNDFVYQEMEIRGIDSNIQDVLYDVINQLNELSNIENKPDLWQIILNFQSLYLKKGINYKKQDWAIIGLTLHFFYYLLIHDLNIGKLKRAFEIENILQFNNYSGIERGNVIKKFKNEFIEKFRKYSKLDVKLLKGKKQTRIFWEIVSPENINDAYDFVIKF